jgi:hypothetical protein
MSVKPLRIDWNKFDLAEAYDLVEGVRRTAAQNPESGIDSALRGALDAIEAADCEWDGITKPAPAPAPAKADREDINEIWDAVSALRETIRLQLQPGSDNLRPEYEAINQIHHMATRL